MLETLPPLATGHGGDGTAKLEALSLVASPHSARRHYAGDCHQQSYSEWSLLTTRQMSTRIQQWQMRSGDNYPLLDWI